MDPGGGAAAGGDEDAMEWFESVAERAGWVQRETLRRILEQNQETEYVRKWLGDQALKVQDMDSCDLEALFTYLLPIVSHADLQPYIDRIAEGDTSPILTQQPITTLSLSSGTTEGRQKLVPFTRHSSLTTLQIFTVAAAYRSRVYPIKEGGRILEFIYSGKQWKTKGGQTVGTATTHYYASEEFKIKQEKTKSFTCSPAEVIAAGDYTQSTYCHLLLGLFFSGQVQFITSTFAYTILQAFSAFEDLWLEIVHDLRDSRLSSRITQPQTRIAVLQIIRAASPDLASDIERKCRELEARDWFGVIPTLWPNAKYVYSIMTGSMQPYVKKLRHYAGELPLVSADYGSTESWIGVNVDPGQPAEDVTFAVVPAFSYFEFIPLHRRRSFDYESTADDFIEDEPVPLSGVKLGQQYEIVLTTFTGLYRCRLGDVVEVAGFHKQTPKLSFVCRRKLILTVNIDKNTEKDLQLVMERACELLASRGGGAELVDFTSHAEVVNSPGHYIIYWEIKGEVEERVLGECCNEMDASFVDYGYVVSRRAESIGPLELRIVERGTFNKIMEYFIGNGAALSQFKTPRCTNNQAILWILDVCTVNRFFSTAYG